MEEIVAGEGEVRAASMNGMGGMGAFDALAGYERVCGKIAEFCGLVGKFVL